MRRPAMDFGSLLQLGGRNLSFRERFDLLAMPEPMSGCWLWIGSLYRTGYGRHYTDGRTVKAHRASWELHRGPIPAGLLVCHRCDNPSCVNPDHLFLGTVKDNSADMKRKGRSYRGAARRDAKLTEDQVRAIRADGRSAYALARLYGLHQKTISRIIKREKWAHIP